MDASLGNLGVLILSLSGIAGLSALLTELLPFGAAGNAKRGQAVLYSLLLTLMAYTLGAVNVPQITAPEFQSIWWWKFVVLSVAASVSAVGAMGGAHFAQKWSGRGDNTATGG